MAGDEEYTLEFIPTQNAPGGAEASMLIKVKNDKPETEVLLTASGLYPNTVYTIWIVYNTLTWPLPTTGTSVPSTSASTRPGFPPEANGVSPLAKLSDAFTSGMGLDPGASFITDENGDGEVNVKVDYDLIQAAPLSNKDLIGQCVPGPPVNGECSSPSKLMRVTTTWLRRFIAEYPLGDRASTCANYNATADPDSAQYDPVASKGMNARLWQCVNPTTVNPGTGEGLPRVHRYQFDHFRLANHPDDLTHGFIGGNGVDHWIDMVGRRADLVQKH
jgi:hypothetical protein